MHIVRDHASLALVADQNLRQTIQQRIDNIASDEPYDSALHGYFVVLDSLDTLANIAAQIGFDPTQRQPEILEEYEIAWDALFIIEDSGYGIELLIPLTIDIPELVAMCKRCAVPGTL